MGRAKALGILAHMAERPDAPLDEVIALQMAFRALAKRMFDRERNFKRRHAAEANAAGTSDEGEEIAVPEEGRAVTE